MTQIRISSAKDKISSQFSGRLSRLGPGTKVRVILMLRTNDAGKSDARRRSLSGRQAAIEHIRKSAKPALIAIDDILGRLGGQRLASAPDALGCIPVETTLAGINELATSDYVKVILEDQPISLLPKPKRP